MLTNADIYELTDLRHFLQQHSERYGKRGLSFAPSGAKALLGHPWPGNIRELDHAIERAVLMARTRSKITAMAVAVLKSSSIALRKPARAFSVVSRSVSASELMM